MAKVNRSAGGRAVSDSAAQTGKKSPTLASAGGKSQVLLQDLYSSEALITEKLFGETERIAKSAEFGVGRRIGLATAAKGGEWFKEIATMPRDGAEAAAVALQEITLHVKSLRQLADLLEIAENRLAAALCARQDFQELYGIAIKEVGTIPSFSPASKEEASHV